MCIYGMEDEIVVIILAFSSKVEGLNEHTLRIVKTVIIMSIDKNCFMNNKSRKLVHTLIAKQVTRKAN